MISKISEYSNHQYTNTLLNEMIIHPELNHDLMDIEWNNGEMVKIDNIVTGNHG